MQRQVIYPPHRHVFSEDVIGNVLQRKWPMRQSLTSENNYQDLGQFLERQERRVHASERNTTQDAASFVSRSFPNETQRRSQMKLSLQDIADVTDPTTMGNLQLILKANRVGRKKIQTRYQNKKKREFSELKDSIPVLREQVNDLQEKRDDLSRKKETLWSACIEYFRLFEKGLPGSTRNALDYLRPYVAPDVDIGTALGLVHLIANWKTLTQFFPDIQTRLDGLTLITPNTVVAKTTTTITITEKSLLAAFPHLVDSSNIQSDRRGYIVANLLGQRIEMSGSVRFDWDTRYNQVVRLYSQSDMLSPILQLVSNLENAELVFSNARISPDGNLVVGAQQQ